MRHVGEHETLGASLMSVAVLAGTVAWMLGWFAIDMPVAGPSPSESAMTEEAATVGFMPSPRVEAQALDPSGVD